MIGHIGTPLLPLIQLLSSSYINAEVFLHGSCAGKTEGLCGNWNGNGNDDLVGGSPNSLGNLNQVC